MIVHLCRVVAITLLLTAGCASGPPTLKETAAAKLGTRDANMGLAVGQPAPDAAIIDIAGQPQQLASMYQSGPTLVVFYRGGWCPFCNVQLNQLSKAKAEFDARGVQLVAISVDLPSEAAKTQAKQGVPFAMCSDPKLSAHRAFNVIHETSAVEGAAMKGFGIDLAAYSGETHSSFAIPSIFLIEGGQIRFAHIDNDYQTRPSPTQLLTIIDKLLRK
jgi:peroxiredoxin